MLPGRRGRFADLVQGDAVVGGGAEEGEAEGGVDGAVEVGPFDDGEALVVVHGEDAGRFRGAWRLALGCRRGGGPSTAIPAARAAGDGGADDAVFFVAEEAAFAGVGVEGADANAGGRGGEVLF